MTTDTFAFNIITFLKNVNCPNTTVTRYINTYRDITEYKNDEMTTLL